MVVIVVVVVVVVVSAFFAHCVDLACIGVPSDVAVQLIASLDIDVSKIVLEKQANCDVPGAAHRFVAKLNTELAKIEVSIIDSPFKPGAAPSPKKGKKAASASDTWQQFDASGSMANAPAAMLAEANIEKGCRIQIDDRVVEVSDIADDGKISYIVVSEHGELLRTMGTIAAADALKCKVQKSRIESFVPTEEQKPWAHIVYREAAYKAFVMAALSSIALGSTSPKVKIVTKPSRKVLAEANYNKGELVMHFDNPKVSLIDKSKPPAVNAKALPIVLSCSEPGDKQVWIASPPLSSEIVVPAWSVAAASSDAPANMAVENKKIAHRLSGIGTEHTIDMILPVLVNTAKISPGDELIVNWKSHIEPKAKAAAKRPAPPKASQPKAKRVA